jgi:hypothetical protein
MKIDKPHMNTRVVNEKTTMSIVPNISITTMAINNHMAIVQVQIDINTIDDVFLDGGLGVNIIIEQLKTRLGLPKPKPAPYNLRMADQTTTKPIGLIKDLRMYVHGIPYIAIFSVL